MKYVILARWAGPMNGMANTRPRNGGGVEAEEKSDWMAREAGTSKEAGATICTSSRIRSVLLRTKMDTHVRFRAFAFSSSCWLVMDWVSSTASRLALMSSADSFMASIIGFMVVTRRSEVKDTGGSSLIVRLTLTNALSPQSDGQNEDVSSFSHTPLGHLLSWAQKAEGVSLAWGETAIRRPNTATVAASGISRLMGKIAPFS